MVTAMGDTPDRIGALRYGADDYVVKPYHPGEVVARVQAVLRRSRQAETRDDVLRWHTLEVDRVAITATVTQDGQVRVLELTPTEFSLLSTLMGNPTVFPPAFTGALSAGERSAGAGGGHARLQPAQKLENAGITGVLANVRGIGYRFRQP